ncbi:AAA family ATPase [Pseudoalteromonas sp. UBA6610]|uniref:AAA family ATPase n=1 Tax=Pseudoalteromonas sp. UBA6610 TaxID=1947294 RepID=UPI0025936964|nr:AAA family ATPase [Pseudoalteromonas sp. UBA6610]|tara:strand:- start:1319 stop:3334 length:2016 start_codon:yes stop_codon:yes gene_type:complete
MLGLTLKKLTVTSITNDGNYYTELTFTKGLNILRAENSSGKSTCVNSIAYALGLDAILGPSRRKPFPRSMHQFLEVSKDDSAPHFVRQSYVELEVENENNEWAKFKRDVEGNKDKVTIYDKSGEIGDFFLGSAGSVGSAKSEMGFHFWLERYINWNLPDLMTHDGKPTRLYLECVFPLFFIEQKRGWSEIQANTPTYYGIKGVKKAAIEFCLGVESYSKKNRLAELNAFISDVEKNWDKIISSAASLAEFGGLRLQLGCTLDKESFFPLISFQVPHQDKSTELEPYINGLKSTLADILNSIKKWPHYNEVSELTATKRSLIREADQFAQRQEALLISIQKNEEKISSITIELDRYKQLKRLHDVGSDNSFEIVVTSCPVCESDMYDSLAKVSVDSKPLSVEQNIEFLKNQLDFYSGIKKRHTKDLEELEKEITFVQSTIIKVQSKIDELKTDEAQFIEIYGKDLKRKVEIEAEIRELTKLLSKQADFNQRAKDCHREWQTFSSELKALRKKSSEDVSFKIRKELKELLVKNLTEFGYKTANQHFLQISEQTLRPELDGYDIVADSSASDYIRIIWSYTLALLELGIANDKVRHGGFVVFDEPRQHETDKGSFASLLNKSSSLLNSGGQVIVATSMNVNELNSYDLKNANIRIFDDGEYILKKDEDEELNGQ